MAQLSLTEEERMVLGDVLGMALSDLRMEIADTDSADYRDKLKRREETLKTILDQLGFPAKSGSL